MTDFKYPDMFPSPPDDEAVEDENVVDRFTSPRTTSNARRSNVGNPPRPPSQHVLERQQWQQNWFFYFTEITLRRIGNRVLNTLYKLDSYPGAGLTITEIIRLVATFDKQLSEL